MKDFSNEIRAYALKNALEYSKAETGKIMPKLFQHGLKKEDIKDVMPIIQKIVLEVNKLNNEEKEKEYQKYKSLVKETEVKEKKLPELENVSGGVITRLPPEPSKYLHLGHALSFLINYSYSKKYNGKCLLRFEDANPEKVAQEYVDAIIDDIQNYLEIKVDSVSYVSDKMDKFYEFAKELIEGKNAYMCFCEREKMQDYRHEGKECECRNKNVKENIIEWDKFLLGKYKEGECVLRLKVDMKNLNHVMRDPVIFRAVYKKHFRTKEKYKVWPMYDFYNPIEDSLMGVTHILRSNEFDVRVELHDYLRKLLNLKNQTVVQYGRFNVIGADTKGRDIREKIESKEYNGWDDPRLMTLKALRRRGISSKVLHELVNYIGLSKKEVKIDFNMVASISRKMLDKEVDRYYFVSNPKELKIKNKPLVKEVEIKKHPDKKETRIVKIGKKIFISEKDYLENEKKEVRLMNLFNLKLDEKAEYLGEENKAKIKKIQWVSDNIKVKIIMPTGETIEGLAEKTIENLKINEVIQFERTGFVKLDKKNKDEYEFRFTHE